MQPLGNVENEAGIECSLSSDEEDQQFIFDEAKVKKDAITKHDIEIINRFVFFDFETTQTDIISETKLGYEY